MKKSELVDKWWFRLAKVLFIVVAIGIYLTSILVLFTGWPRKEVITSKSSFVCIVQFNPIAQDGLVYPFDKNGIYSFNVNDDDTLDSYTRDSVIRTCRSVEKQKILAATSTADFISLSNRYGLDAYRSYDYVNDQSDVNYALHVEREYTANRVIYTSWFIGWTIIFAILLKVLVFMFYYIICGKKRFE